MEIKIYIDVLLLTNFCLDGFLLWLTGFLLHNPPRRLRLFLAACIGAIDSLIAFFMPENLFLSLPVQFLSAVVMVSTAFPSRSLRAFCKQMSVFFSLSFSVGGLSFALLYLTGLGALMGSVFRNGTLYLNLPVFIMPLLMLLGYGLTKLTLAAGAIRPSRQNLFSLEIQFNGKTVNLRGFYDSGNLLRSSDGRGVMITQWQAVRHLFPERTPDGLTTKIPCRTLQGKSQLPAFLPDAIYIKKDRTKRQIEPVYVAVTEKSLNHYHQWDTILPSNFEGVENSEAPVFTETV